MTSVRHHAGALRRRAGPGGGTAPIEPKGILVTWTMWRPPGAPFPYSTAMHDDELMLVTEAGHDPETGDIPESAEDQARMALRKVTARLDEAGFTVADVIAIRSYVTAREHAEVLDRVFADALPEPRPYTGALLIVELFDPRQKIEVEIVAQKNAVKQ